MQLDQEVMVKNRGSGSAGFKSRIIGRYGGESEGPTVICIGSLHGNEPAGIAALKRVFDRLTKLSPTFRGQLIGVSGNLKALDKGIRYIEEDLNRIWKPHIIDGLLVSGKHMQARSAEEAERSELIEIFAQICQKKNSAVYFLDLHTTSAQGSPFITIADTLRNRAFTEKFPVPRILGIEEQLDSTLLNYINEWGFIAVGFEAGQHDEESSVENSIAALWMMLVGAGCIDPEEIPDYQSSYSELKKASMNNAGIYEVCYRHDIENDAGFSMKPGYLNFQDIRKGEVLAKNYDDEVISPENGKIFMPLYQKQGNDGFFVIKRINPLWLKLSSLLRRLRADRILSYLPGINSQNGANRTIAVNLSIAKWYVIELLHMLGYRKKSLEKGMLIASRRRFDIKAPLDYRFDIEFKDV